MAQQSQIPYDEAMAGLEAEKAWPEGLPIDWIALSQKKFPSGYSFRASLSLNGRYPEGLFVDLYYKPSVFAQGKGPDKIYMQLLVNSAVVFAIHENGLSRHLNRVGQGMPFYRQAVGHPHVHLPVREASYGYSEPLERASLGSLWASFIDRANIIGAPDLELPEHGQGLLI